MIRNSVLLSIITLSLGNASHIQAQIPPPPSSPSKPSSTTTGTGGASAGAATTGTKKPQGLVSEKTKMPFSKAQPEDITNENYPDLIDSFDYTNAEIGDVIEAMSKLTGKNFIVDPQVRGKITILAPSQITVAEAYRAFLSALAINGFTIVPYGNFLKVMSTRNAQRSSIETYSGNYFPDTDQLITRIIRLKYISADEVNKNLRILNSKDGEMVPYPPTNSLIITDFGSNIDRVMKIISQLDVPGFEEQLQVIRIRYARSKDITEMINKIINKGDPNAGNRFAPGIPRFRTGSEGGSGGNAESYSLVVSDDRTNSIIVVGNKAGIEKIRKLVSQLDFRLRPEDRGGVYVYHVRHTEAEKLATTLNGIATDSKKAQEQANPAGGAAGMPALPRPGQEVGTSSAQAVFGNDVKFTPDKITNSLLITASRQDYEIIKSILAKIDIPRDQVFVRAVIMEMNVSDQMNWGINYYKFAADTNGVGRMGFRSGALQELIDPSKDSGGILGFGAGGTMNINIPGLPGTTGSSTTGTTGSVTVASLTGLIKFFKTNTQANILSTPQVTALNNEEALIEVGEKVPVSKNSAISAGGVSQSTVERQDVTIKLEITPYISPDTDIVQMKIKQSADGISTTTVKASQLADSAIVTLTRKINTQIVVHSGDTAVLGGLMKDQDDESITKVPILGDIPILGWLFKSKGTERKKMNLMVFLSPTIVRNMEDNAKIMNSKINERVDFIQKSASGRDPFGETIDRLPRRALGSESKSGSGKGMGPGSGTGASDEIDMSEPDSEKEEPAVEVY